MVGRPRLRPPPSRIRALQEAFEFAASDHHVLSTFMKDLMTPGEIDEMANRWAIARSLLGGRNQTATVKALRLSKDTVGRVAKWVDGVHSNGGFRGVFELERNVKKRSSTTGDKIHRKGGRRPR